MRGRKPSLKTLKAEQPKTAPLAIPRCPAMLKGEARKEWDRMMALLYDLGLVANLDRSTLAQHCKAWARWVEAEANVDAQGTIVKSPNGYPIQNPYLSVSNQAAKQMQSLLSEFGLSPAARHRLLGAPKTDEAPKTTGFEGVLANVG